MDRQGSIYNKNMYPITDNLMQEVSRIAAYGPIIEVFGIIGNFSINLSTSEISEGVRCMCKKYPEISKLK